MKAGITFSLEKLDFPYIVFNGMDMQEVFSKINKIGYRGIDLLAGNIKKSNLNDINKAAIDSGIEVANYLSFGLSKKGITLTEKDKQKRRKCIDLLKTEIEKAILLSSKYITIGTFRGNIGKEDDKFEYYELLAESMSQINNFIIGEKINLCLEAINRLEVNVLNSVKECVWFLDEYCADNVKILADVFHMNIEEKNIYESILLAKDRIGHVHIEDTNRMFPGCGHANYEKIFDALHRIEYRGYVSIESEPLPNAYECAEKGIEHLKHFI